MVQQGKETDPVKRKALIDEMQQLAYDQAPYHVLFYDAALHAYRTDKFGGWTLQPTEGGLPFFAYGAARLQPADGTRAGRDPGALAPGAAPPVAPGSSTRRGRRRQPGARAPRRRTPSSSANTPLLIGGALLLIVAVVVVLALRRGRTTREEE